VKKKNGPYQALSACFVHEKKTGKNSVESQKKNLTLFERYSECLGTFPFIFACMAKYLLNSC